MIFRKLQMFPRTFQQNTLQSLKMSRMRLAGGSFWRGRPSFDTLLQFFRSALRLPSNYLRFANLSAPAPVPAPYRNRFWFRSPLLLLVPAVLLVTFFALRHSLPRQADVASEPASSLQTNWQSAVNDS